MDLYPAVDIRGGCAVRLYQGDYGQETVYDADPVGAAKRWVDQGARKLHVVDLDGAREGRLVNLGHVGRIAESVTVPVQFGGGLRSVRDIGNALDVGVQRVVLGTAAIGDPDFLGESVERFADRVVVSVDVREGLLAMAGWVETSTVPAIEAIERLQLQGVKRFVYTNISRDGTLEGPDLEEIEAIGSVVTESFICAGGIGDIGHIVALAQLQQPQLEGVIVGKALYEGKFTAGQAQSILDRAGQ